MADSNLYDNVSETIINLFKKTQIIEKIDKVRFNICSFFMISSIIGLTSIYINYYSVVKIKRLEEKIKESENVLKNNIEINRKQHLIIYNNLIDKLQEEINNSSKLLDNIREFKDMKLDMISKSTSVSSFSPIKIIMSPKNDNNDCIIKNDHSDDGDDGDWIKHNIDKKNNNSYDEYDHIIPINNSNKNKSFNWFFTPFNI